MMGVEFDRVSRRKFEHKVRKVLEHFDESDLDTAVKCIVDVGDVFLGKLWELHKYWVMTMKMHEDVGVECIADVLREEKVNGRLDIKDDEIDYVARRMHVKQFHGSRHKI